MKLAASRLLGVRFCKHYFLYPPVAKLDIAADSDSEGRGFESHRAGQIKMPENLAFMRVSGIFIFLRFPENIAKIS